MSVAINKHCKWSCTWLNRLNSIKVTPHWTVLDILYKFILYPPTAVYWTLPPHPVSGTLVEVTHNSELSTEHILPSPLSTSTPVLSPMTTSTELVHTLCYGFIIFVLSYSVTLLDVKTISTSSQLQAGMYLYTCVGTVSDMDVYTTLSYILSLSNQASELHTCRWIVCTTSEILPAGRNATCMLHTQYT